MMVSDRGKTSMEKNIVIGVSGASGIAIAAAVLEHLQKEQIGRASCRERV